MSVKIRNFLKDYIRACLDARLGKNYSTHLTPEEKEHIAVYVERNLYNLLRPAGAAPIPKVGDSEECEDLLRILKEEPEKNKVKLILPEVEAYIRDAEILEKKIGEEITEEERFFKKKKKILVEAQ